MFNKNDFANILNKIVSRYQSISEFAIVSKTGRSYISKYINKKLDAPPSPKILEKIALSSRGETTYKDLMFICGYSERPFGYGIVGNYYTIPILISDNGNLIETKQDLILPFEWDHINTYFAYKVDNEDMLPLLGTGDIAIIQKTDKYENGNTCLISLDSNLILIRKILDFNNYIELQTAFPFNPPIKLSKEEINTRNFKILGKVIRVENESAFK